MNVGEPTAAHVSALVLRTVRASLLLVLGVLPFFVTGASLSITAKVEAVVPPTPGPTKVIFKGLAYPDSRVRLERDGALVASVPADPTAHFEIEVSGLAAGTYTFSLSGTDAAGRVGKAMQFAVSITEGTTITMNGIFLGPTIILDKTTARLGDTVTVLGATVPESAVTILVSSEEERTFKTTADRRGGWVHQFIAEDLGIGTHSVRAKAVAPTQEISDFSAPVSFAITEGEPKPCDGKLPGDLNCDGKVNLVDFSVLLFYWNKKKPANDRADINHDGRVTIRDLSILLYWWTG